jgi:5-deoxy-glucuronate isomerase
MTGLPLATRHRLGDGPGVHVLEGGLGELGFALLRAATGAPARVELGDREGLLVLLEGSAATVSVDDAAFELPPRGSVFTDGPSAVYAPPGSVLELRADARLAGLYTAGARGAAPTAYAVLPEEVEVVHRGQGNFARQVRDILPEHRPGTRLLVGETINPPGNWSSAPPHKHDRNAPPAELAMEEVYLFRVDPPQGFGLQLSYHADPPAEAAYPVRDLDVVAIPAGYHPVVAGPGYGLYYLWGLAGSARTLRWYADPVHAWVDTT